MNTFREISKGLRFPEGPIAMADGSVLLVEIERQTLSRVKPDGTVEVVATTGGGPNGAAIGPDGKCYICNNGDWTKSKCRAGHEVVIGGWTTDAGQMRSLLAGVYRGKHLVADFDAVDISVDGARYFSMQNPHQGDDWWPFDKSFYVILNLAVGGNWGGAQGVDPNVWPQRMLVDWVRVYRL